MSMEVVQSLLAWKEVCPNNWNLADASTVQTAHAVMAMVLYILQVVIGLDDASSPWGIDGKCDAALPLGIGLSANNIIPFKVL